MLWKGDEQAQPGNQQESNDELARPDGRRRKMLGQRLNTVLAEATDITVDTDIEGIA